MVFSQPRMMRLLFVIRNRTWFLFALGLSRGWTCFVHKRLLPHLFAGSLRFASSHDLQADCSSKCLWRSFISFIFLHSRSKPIKLNSPLSTLFRSSSRSSSFKFPLRHLNFETGQSIVVCKFESDNDILFMILVVTFCPRISRLPYFSRMLSNSTWSFVTEWT